MMPAEGAVSTTAKALEAAGDGEGARDIGALDEASGGADRKLAPRIADAVLDWRDDNSLRRPNGAEDRDYRTADRPGGAADAPFAHIGELRQLLPIEPEDMLSWQIWYRIERP